MTVDVIYQRFDALRKRTVFSLFLCLIVLFIAMFPGTEKEISSMFGVTKKVMESIEELKTALDVPEIKNDPKIQSYIERIGVPNEWSLDSIVNSNLLNDIEARRQLRNYAPKIYETYERLSALRDFLVYAKIALFCVTGVLIYQVSKIIGPAKAALQSASILKDTEKSDVWAGEVVGLRMLMLIDLALVAPASVSFFGYPHTVLFWGVLASSTFAVALVFSKTKWPANLLCTD